MAKHQAEVLDKIRPFPILAGWSLAMTQHEAESWKKTLASNSRWTEQCADLQDCSG